MADSYQMFSEAIGRLTKDEIKWLREEFARVMFIESIEEEEERSKEWARFIEEYGYDKDLDIDDVSCIWPGCHMELDPKGKVAHLYSDENCDFDLLIPFIQKFLAQFRPTDVFTITSSITCSKMRLQEFGGEWLVITQSGVDRGNTWDAIENRKAELRGVR